MTPLPSRGELLRCAVFHTPHNPFTAERALQGFLDGGLLLRDGRVTACGDFSQVRAQYPDATLTDLRGGLLIPGLVDTHVHFPQVLVLGSLGRSLLDWLEQSALPEESRMADACYAKSTARTFVDGLASHGTTTALVFGSHFAPATASLFKAARQTGLRIVSGLVMSDRSLRDDLHQSPEIAYRECTELIRKYHGVDRLRYAVTPRFALSASEAMLEVCQTLLQEHAGVRFQTHLNENQQEIAQVAGLFPWATDYLDVYERFDLVNDRAVMAHSVHTTGSELERLAASRTTVAHCPASNAALGSGIFSMRRHLAAGVRFALGTDVGGGTGFGMLKEGLQSYLMQRVAPQGMLLNSEHLLYLATRAGAEALGMENDIGDFGAGKSADFVYLRAPAGTPLALLAQDCDDPERLLAALFTLGDRECVQEVRVEGTVVYRRS